MNRIRPHEAMRKAALLNDRESDERIHCFLCAHECRIPPNKFGLCGVRQNLDGRLFTLVYDQPIAAHCDPIEKKPLYHFLPGSMSYSVATIGCNFHCPFCQNWQISQLNRRTGQADDIPKVTAVEIVEQAVLYHADSISYTYTEPTIFFEYAYDIARLAKAKNLANIFVTNGYMSAQALQTIRPYLDAANVDLKSFREEFYNEMCGARLAPVLETIRRMRDMGIWVEVTTLVIPGQNDSDEELKELTRFLVSVDRHIPWHISRFHPDYRYTDSSATPLETLHRARDIGRQAGLRFIYLGNVLEEADTFCPQCGSRLIARQQRRADAIRLKDNQCPQCQERIPGVWEKKNEK